jgi:hypothetical protein
MKNYTLKIFSFFIATCLFCAVLVAQGKVYDYNTIAWNQIITTIKTGKKTSAHIEYNWRRTNLYQNWQQSLIRVAVNYYVDNQLNLHIGYANADNFIFGDYPAIGNIKENRLYEQIALKSNYKKVNITQRLRIEQRWVSVLNSLGKIDKWNYTNRFRLMEKLQLPLKKDYFIAIMDEIFINAGKNVVVNIFDQNRIWLSTGKKVNKNITIELGYFNHIQQQGKLVNNKIIVQRNNGLLLALLINL